MSPHSICLGVLKLQIFLYSNQRCNPKRFIFPELFYVSFDGPGANLPGLGSLGLDLFLGLLSSLLDPPSSLLGFSLGISLPFYHSPLRYIFLPGSCSLLMVPHTILAPLAVAARAYGCLAGSSWHDNIIIQFRILWGFWGFGGPQSRLDRPLALLRIAPPAA